MTSGIKRDRWRGLGVMVMLSIALSAPALAVKFPPTGGRGAPSRTAGGGTRGPVCVTDSRPLTVLLPESGLHSFVGPGLSLVAYLPKTRASRLEFKVLDGRNRLLQRLDLSTFLGQPGLRVLPIGGLEGLEPEREYRWVLSLVCDPLDRSVDRWVRGTVVQRRLGADVAGRLRGRSRLVQAGIYAQELIWQEALLGVMAERLRSPSDWRELLGSVGLGDWGTVPVVDRGLP